MGACFGRCCPAIIHFRRKLFGRSTAYDQANLVEFDMLSSPNFEEPISEQFGPKVPTADVVINLQTDDSLRDDEDEAFVVDTRRETQRVARLANSGHLLINPARLLFRESVSSWGDNAIAGTTDNDDNDLANGNKVDDDMDFLMHEEKFRRLTSRTYLPNHSMFMDTGSSTVSSVNGKEWPTNGSTPPSSLDLEWDEAGVFMPSESNKNSTPASNDLEWDDDDFDRNSTSNQTTNAASKVNNGSTLDVETEQLISEIERLTSNALDEANHGYR